MSDDLSDEEADGIAAVVAAHEVSACETTEGRALVIEVVTLEGSTPLLFFPDQARDLVGEIINELIVLEEMT